MKEPRLPNRAFIEEPLLKALIDLGGSIDFATQGRILEIKLAKEFKLPDEVRDFAATNYHAQGNRKWRNHLQFVRDRLAQKHFLFREPRGRWTVTDAGYKHVGMQKPATRLR